MNKITIYTNETCPYCKLVKEELTKNSIEFENLLTNDNRSKWDDIVSLTGIPSVPTIIHGEEYLVPGRDFRSADHLVEVVKNHKTTSFSAEKRTIEMLKTLNYNIGVAFSRTNQILTQIETKLNVKDDGETS
jgi:glutaredoxin 3